MKLKEDFIESVPAVPGVYFFKQADGSVIYIGKAKSLKNRLMSYFQKPVLDWKIDSLLSEYTTIEYIATKNETEALLLEADLISTYKPKYNVLLKSGQPFVYILATEGTPSTLKFVRNKKEKGTYIGPFLQKQAARAVYQFVMRRFNLNMCNKKIENGCLDYHIGNCAGSCKKNFDAQSYALRVQLAVDALRSDHEAFAEKIKLQIDTHVEALEFEKAQQLQLLLADIDIIFTTIKTYFQPKKYATDIFLATTNTPRFFSIADGVAQRLQELTGSQKLIYTIDCFDISHFQGKQIVGSCIRFSHGIPVRNKFRRFQIKSLVEQNDYAALQEIVTRRYAHTQDYPDLIVIDGGKGQKGAVKAVIDMVPVISLAKREETLFTDKHPEGIILDMHDPTGKLLIQLRDYAHHFAISYHRKKRKSI